MPKSKARNVYEKLAPSDQTAVDVKTGRLPGVKFTKNWPTVSFDTAVRDVAGRPGAYTTKPGDVIRSSRMRKKVSGRSF